MPSGSDLTLAGLPPRARGGPPRQHLGRPQGGLGDSGGRMRSGSRPASSAAGAGHDMPRIVPQTALTCRSNTAAPTGVGLAGTCGR